MPALKSEIKIQNLKLFQSVKLGGSELTYIQDAKYNITYLPHNHIILIEDKADPKFRAFTPMANIPWMHPAEEIYEETKELVESINIDEPIQQETAYKNLKGSGKKKN